MAIDYGKVNTDASYPHSLDFNFTPTDSPLPQQKKDYNTFNTDFTNFLGSQETVPQLQSKYGNMYNVPFLQDTAQKQNQTADMIGNQLRALPASINSSTQNSLLTQGQKDRMVQAAQAPLATQYTSIAGEAGRTNQALGTAQTNQNTAVTSEQAQQMKMVAPWLQKYDAMTIMNAAENTQWTQKNQWELNRLLANQSTGAQLSEGQQSRLEHLASQENLFQAQMEQIKEQGNQARLTKKAPTDLATLWSSMMG